MTALFDDPVVDALLDELSHVKGWPSDPAKDDAFVRGLIRQYPTLDLTEEIRQWATWMNEHDSKGKVNYRVRIQRWCSNAVQWRVDRRLGGKGSRPSVANEIDAGSAARLGWSGSLPPNRSDASGWGGTTTAVG